MHLACRPSQMTFLRAQFPMRNEGEDKIKKKRPVEKILRFEC